MSAGRHINSLSQSWCTPPKYVEVVKRFFDGNLSLDPCSNEYSLVKAKNKFSLPQNDGLKEIWNYPTIYVNPPYGIDKERKTTIKNWLAKCAGAYREYNSEVLALIPVAANTAHWKKYVFTQAHGICFLYDTRLKFLENGKDGGKGAPMACAMIYWGNRFKRFYDMFIEYGAVVDISFLIGEKIGDDRKNKMESLKF
ncbi:MAG: DNA N-6-adenine-methyltransferase [Ignavibacteriaceae bacterium]|nr:DNA N-6-adenine-methyltransferase [Ignavibacteriaceae bacterium]